MLACILLILFGCLAPFLFVTSGQRRNTVFILLVHVASTAVAFFFLRFVWEGAEWFAFVDDEMYWRFAEEARLLEMSFIDTWRAVPGGKNPGYYVISSLVYELTGGARYGMLCANFAVLSIILGIFFRLLFESNVRSDVAFLMAVVVAWMPDLKFWALFQFKDVWVALAVFLYFWSVQYRRYIPMLISLALVFLLRVELTFLLIFSTFVGGAISHTTSSINKIDHGRLFILLIPLVAVLPESKWLIGGALFSGNIEVEGFSDLLNVNRSNDAGLIEYFYILEFTDIYKLPASIMVYLLSPIPIFNDVDEAHYAAYRIFSVPWQVIVFSVFVTICRFPERTLNTIKSSALLASISVYVAAELIFGAIFMFEFSPGRHRYAAELAFCLLVPVLVWRGTTQETRAQNILLALGAVVSLNIIYFLIKGV